jgi:hypothetical protein
LSGWVKSAPGTFLPPPPAPERPLRKPRAQRRQSQCFPLLSSSSQRREWGRVRQELAKKRDCHIRSTHAARRPLCLHARRRRHSGPHDSDAKVPRLRPEAAKRGRPLLGFFFFFFTQRRTNTQRKNFCGGRRRIPRSRSRCGANPGETRQQLILFDSLKAKDRSPRKTGSRELKLKEGGGSGKGACHGARCVGWGQWWHLLTSLTKPVCLDGGKTVCVACFSWLCVTLERHFTTGQS